MTSNSVVRFRVLFSASLLVTASIAAYGLVALTFTAREKYHPALMSILKACFYFGWVPGLLGIAILVGYAVLLMRQRSPKKH